MVSLYDTIDFVTENLAFSWMVIEIIVKYSHFLWNLMALGTYKNVPTGRGGKSRKCMDA